MEYFEKLGFVNPRISSGSTHTNEFTLGFFTDTQKTDKIMYEKYLLFHSLFRGFMNLHFDKLYDEIEKQRLENKFSEDEDISFILEQSFCNTIKEMDEFISRYNFKKMSRLNKRRRKIYKKSGLRNMYQMELVL